MVPVTISELLRVFEGVFMFCDGLKVTKDFQGCFHCSCDSFLWHGSCES